MTMLSLSTAASRVATSHGVARQGAKHFSANAKVWIDKDTRVICQGFTGKQVRYYIQYIYTV